MNSLFSLFHLKAQISLRVTFLCSFWFGLLFRTCNFFFFQINHVLTIYVLVFLLFLVFFFNEKRVKNFISILLNKNFRFEFNKLNRLFSLQNKLALFSGILIFGWVEPLYFCLEQNDYFFKACVLFLSFYKILIFFSLSLTAFLGSDVLKEYSVFHVKMSNVTRGAAADSVFHALSHQVPKDVLPTVAVVLAGAIIAKQEGNEARKDAGRNLEQSIDSAKTQIDECNKELAVISSKSKHLEEMMNSPVVVKAKSFRQGSQPTSLGEMELAIENQKKLDALQKQEELLRAHSRKANDIVEEALEQQEKLDQMSDIKVGLAQVGSFVGNPELSGSVVHRSQLLKAESIRLSVSPVTNPSLQEIPSVLEIFFF